MKILAFAASNSKISINKQLVMYVANRLKSTKTPDATIETLDLDDYELALYRPDREEAGGVPALAQDFYAKIGSSDVVLVSFAEHNGLYTAAYKNLFDWTSRIDRKVYQDKPMILLATSPGARGASNVLKIATESAPHFGMDVRASISVPSFQDNFDSTAGELTNPELVSQIDAAMDLLNTPE
ncbi:MAG: NAD(P)H-dependent oxidoreductase [Planctomycetota bacterium]